MAKHDMQPVKNAFQVAVEKTPDISSAYCKGLQALSSVEASKIIVTDKRLLDGSVDIDKAVKALYIDDNRWDYAIGYNSKICFIEVHPAITSEVETMKKKLLWLKLWLRSKAPEMNQCPHTSPAYVWIQSGKGAILPGSRQAKSLSLIGLTPVPILRLM